MDLRMTKWHRTIHTRGSTVDLWVWISLSNYVRRNHGGNWVKGTQDLSVLSLQVPLDL